MIPADLVSTYLPKTDDLKYQDTADSQSQLLTHVYKAAPMLLAKTSDDCRFATAVAGFGLVLRESDYRGKATYGNMTVLASNAFGSDSDGYQRELVRLVGVAGGLK